MTNAASKRIGSIVSVKTIGRRCVHGLQKSDGRGRVLMSLALSSSSPAGHCDAFARDRPLHSRNLHRRGCIRCCRQRYVWSSAILRRCSCRSSCHHATRSIYWNGLSTIWASLLARATSEDSRSGTCDRMAGFDVGRRAYLPDKRCSPILRNLLLCH